VAWWSAHKLPLVTGCVDILLLDLPFGKISKKVPKHYRAKVPRYVEEIARVLRPREGRCVFLTQSHQHLLACLDSLYFRVGDIQVKAVNIGGYVCYVVLARRSITPFSTKAPLVPTAASAAPSTSGSDGGERSTNVETSDTAGSINTLNGMSSSSIGKKREFQEESGYSVI